MQPISATIITLNEEKTIKDCILSLQLICDEILILDSQSTDHTIKIAKELGATVYTQTFLGDGPQKKKSASLAKNDWILSIDADEKLTQTTINYLKKLALPNKKIGYAFRRKNFLGTKWLQNIYPDYKIRLYHRKFSSYDDSMIHSRVHSAKRQNLPIDIIHQTFVNYTDWIAKLNFYSTKEAEHQIIYRKGKRITYATIIGHSLATLIKKLILQGGLWKGKNGLMSSITISFHTFAKYIKMLEIQENKEYQKGRGH